MPNVTYHEKADHANYEPQRSGYDINFLHGRRAVRAKTNRAHNQTTASPPALGSVVQVGELSPGARRRHHDKTVLTLYRYKHIFPRWTCFRWLLGYSIGILGDC